MHSSEWLINTLLTYYWSDTTEKTNFCKNPSYFGEKRESIHYQGFGIIFDVESCKKGNFA